MTLGFYCHDMSFQIRICDRPNVSNFLTNENLFCCRNTNAICYFSLPFTHLLSVITWRFYILKKREKSKLNPNALRCQLNRGLHNIVLKPKFRSNR